MNERIELLIAQIRDDLKGIEKIKTEYTHFIASLEQHTPDKYQKMVIGYLLHNFYNACENIFLNIAKTFENNIDPQTWHKSILKRMKLELEGIRPAVIDESLYADLDDFRAFRHVFRHIYSYELDWQKEKIPADKFLRTAASFSMAMTDFIALLRKLKS